MKDEADRKLEALFRSDAIADDGFSDRVVRRIRRNVWIRRWTMPIAIAVGGSIAVKPVIDILSLLPALVTIMPENIKEMPADMLPQWPILIAGLALTGIMALFVRMMEE